MPQIFLAAQVLHTADDARLDPLGRRPLHALRRAGPACSWTRFQSRSRIARLELMKAEPTYFAVARSAIRAKAGFPFSRSTPSRSSS